MPTAFSKISRIRDQVDYGGVQDDAGIRGGQFLIYDVTLDKYVLVPAVVWDNDTDRLTVSGNAVQLYGLGDLDSADSESIALGWNDISYYLHTLKSGSGSYRDLSIKSGGAVISSYGDDDIPLAIVASENQTGNLFELRDFDGSLLGYFDSSGVPHGSFQTVPGGSGTELQYRLSATAFGAVVGSSYVGGAVTLPATIISLSNTNYTTPLTYSHLLLANANDTYGQTSITSKFGSAVGPKLRFDYIGNIVTSATGSGGYYFYTGGDEGTGGTSKMTIASTGATTINAASGNPLTVQQGGVNTLRVTYTNTTGEDQARLTFGASSSMYIESRWGEFYANAYFNAARFGAFGYSSYQYYIPRNNSSNDPNTPHSVIRSYTTNSGAPALRVISNDAGGYISPTNTAFDIYGELNRIFQVRQEGSVVINAVSGNPLTVQRNGVAAFTVATTTSTFYESTTNTVPTTGGVIIEQGSTGDALLSFLLSGTQLWQIGIDNSDSDKFKIGRSSLGFDTSTTLTIDNNGATTINAASGNPLTVQANGTTALTIDSNRNALIYGGYSGAPLTIHCPAGLVHPLIGFKVDSTVYAYTGVAAATDGIIAGAVLGDYCIRANNQSIILSVDTGVTQRLKIDGTVAGRINQYYNSANYISTTVASNGDTTFAIATGTTTNGFSFVVPNTNASLAAGGLTVKDSASPARTMVMDFDAGNVCRIGTTTNYHLSIIRGGAAVIRINTSNEVGIGGAANAECSIYVANGGKVNFTSTATANSPMQIKASGGTSGIQLLNTSDVGLAIDSSGNSAFGGTVSCPGAGASSERFGAGSTAAGNYSSVFGNGASGAGISSSSFGLSCAAGGVGASAYGYGGSAGANYSVTVGYQATVGASHTGSIALGTGVSTAANQIIAGSAGVPINAFKLITDGVGGSLNFGVTSGNLTITPSGGKVGINGSPTACCHVFSTVNAGLTVQSSTGEVDAAFTGTGQATVGIYAGVYGRILASTGYDLCLGADSTIRQRIMASGKVGFNTQGPDKQVEINSATGDCLRLTYNDANGTAANYVDFAVSSGGNLVIAPSGGTTAINGYLDIYDGTYGNNSWWRFTSTYSVGNRTLELASANTGAVAFRHNSDTGVMWMPSLIGVNTTNPGKQFEINSATGDCLRLTYNDSNGSAGSVVDFAVTSAGNGNITPSGGGLTISGNIGIGIGTVQAYWAGLTDSNWRTGMVSGTITLSRSLVTANALCSVADANANQGWAFGPNGGGTAGCELSAFGQMLLQRGLTVNESGDDYDTRIEGDTDANLLICDAGTDSVLIGTATPASNVKLRVAGSVQIDGKIITPSAGTITIAGGIVTATASFHAIDTEAAAVTDDLDTINGGTAGMHLYLRLVDSARDVVIKDGTGNIVREAGDLTLTTTKQIAHLLYDGTNWIVIN